MFQTEEGLSVAFICHAEGLPVDQVESGTILHKEEARFVSDTREQETESKGLKNQVCLLIVLLGQKCFYAKSPPIPRLFA